MNLSHDPHDAARREAEKVQPEGVPAGGPGQGGLEEVFGAAKAMVQVLLNFGLRCLDVVEIYRGDAGRTAVKVNGRGIALDAFQLQILIEMARWNLRDKRAFVPVEELNRALCRSLPYSNDVSNDRIYSAVNRIRGKFDRACGARLIETRRGQGGGYRLSTPNVFMDWDIAESALARAV